MREQSGGANGLYFDAAGRLAICEGGNRRMTRLEADGSLTLLMDGYDGKKLNSPNDLWVAPGGDIYFSDPRYGDAGNVEQDGMHVYLIPADGRAPLRVTTDLVTPNGLIGTPDGRTLYIADAGARRIWRYTCLLYTSSSTASRTPASSPWAASPGPATSAPVSYTHLDVYKRQML